MNDNLSKKEETLQIIDPDIVKIIIPQCCREGWDSCTHVPKKQKKVKSNVGL